MKKFVSIGVVGILVLAAGLLVLDKGSKNARVGTPLAVGTLATRDHFVSIYSDGGERTYYSVASRNGEVLGDMLDESALQAEFPDLYRQMKTGIAGQNDDTIIWSELDLPAEIEPSRIHRGGGVFEIDAFRSLR